ncbi:response regulator [Halohasta salina]|uniref:response regulator n=1 Tax=Halohasta salina TaxID=2961621 RepID=UPI0020A4BEEC|nr:response regulator [Halohasta salina]
MNTPHVLLVEDSNFMATKVVETLESAHEFVITTVSTADEARNALKNGSYDCMISNYELPDESGVELAESLDDPEIPSVPLIILTGRALEPLAREAIEAGVAEFVYKGDQATGEMDVLANRIRTVLLAHRAKTEL